MWDALESMFKFLLVVTIIAFLFYGFSIIWPTLEEKNSEVIVTEGTIADKKVLTRYVSTGKSAVPIKEYSIVADVADKQYKIKSTATMYNSVSKNDSMMFKVYYSDDKVTSVAFATEEDLLEEVSTE